VQVCAGAFRHAHRLMKRAQNMPNHHTHLLDSVREADSGFIYEQGGRFEAVASNDVRVLTPRHDVDDPYRAIDALVARWNQLLDAHEAVDARVLVFVGYETQAAAFASSPLPASHQSVPEVLVMVPQQLSIVELRDDSIRRLALPWSDDLLGDDFMDWTRPGSRMGEGSATTTRDAYIARVEAVKDKITTSELDQAVVSMVQTFDSPPPIEELYVALRRLNPSPQMFMFKAPGFSVAGSTPLRLFELRGRNLRVETDGGTRAVVPGHAAPTELWTPTEKERHEHELLVDALHEDLGPLVEPDSLVAGGSLVERRFSHVRHLFASATGTVAVNATPGALLRGLTPHGAVTGAPKHVAVDTIAQVEGVGRGAYGGIVGLVGPFGDMDVACIIRSFVVEDELLRIQAGAGIVVLSDPEAEYRECWQKSQALLDVIGAVGQER